MCSAPVRYPRFVTPGSLPPVGDPHRRKTCDGPPPHGHLICACIQPTFCIHAPFCVVRSALPEHLRFRHSFHAKHAHCLEGPFCQTPSRSVDTSRCSVQGRERHGHRCTARSATPHRNTFAHVAPTCIGVGGSQRSPTRAACGCGTGRQCTLLAMRTVQPQNQHMHTAWKARVTERWWCHELRRVLWITHEPVQHRENALLRAWSRVKTATGRRK